MALNQLDPKDPDTPATYSINWRKELVLELQRETEYVLGAVGLAPADTGFDYECTKAGRTSYHYPRNGWPRAAGEVVRFGTAEFAARQPGTVSIPTIQSAVWALPAALTEDSKSEEGTVTHITISGGVDGEDYELTCRMTPSTGSPIERTIVVPVRHR